MEGFAFDFMIKSILFRTLFLLGKTSCLNDFVRGAKNGRIYPAASDWNLKLARGVIIDFFSRNWRAAFGLLSDPVKNLLFAILFTSRMLPSMSR
jgi:AAA+ ATPase superfamily predicted ATPase